MRERKPIDAALKEFLGANPRPSSGDLVTLGRAAMLEALHSRESIPGLPNDVTAEDFERGRLYKPPGANPKVVLVYFHGGGWVYGSVATHDPFLRLLSKAASVQIASIEYRLAPEHPFPAAVEDARAAVDWALRSFETVAIGGDSAGANLAASAADARLAAQLLLFPVTDHPSARHPSYAENATGNGLESSLMEWLWQQYGAQPDDPRASVLRATIPSGLPPTLIATAEYDPLRDDGLLYADKLEKAGVPVTRIHFDDMHHNFPVHPSTVMRFPQSIDALQRIASWLTSRLR
jgi:acetyl esterase